MTTIGYLLPTRESVMADRPEVGPLLALAERAESLGYGGLWVGDSLLARPRHEPLTLLAAVAARTTTATLGTAVLLPALRDPVVLAHLAATVDLISEGRLVLGVGMAPDTPPVRAEFAATGTPFEARGRRMVETMEVCRALWSGETVNRPDDDLFPLDGVELLPAPHRPGGPPIWVAGSGPLSQRRAAERFHGWFPISPNQAQFADGVAAIAERAAAAGRQRPTVAQYLTVAVDDDAARADAAIDSFLEDYYGVPGPALRKAQACYGGSLDAVTEWIDSWSKAGADHLVLRFVTDHEGHLEQLAGITDSTTR